MRRYIRVPLFLSLLVYGLASGQGISESLQQMELGRQLGALTIPLLNDVSTDWSFTALQKHVGSFADGNRGEFEQMLRKASALGKFKKCTDLQQGSPTDLNIPGAIAAVGKCDFERGVGDVSIIFVPISGKLQAVVLIVHPVN